MPLRLFFVTALFALAVELPARIADARPDIE